MANVFLAMPNYDGKIDCSTAQCAYALATTKHRVLVCPYGKSLLTGNCNSLLAMAYNERERLSIDWFAMLHADVEPTASWLDVLIDEAEAHQADLMSAVVAIKDDRGVTSTAIGNDVGHWRQFGRLTMQQVWHPQFPETFAIDDVADALESMPAPHGLVVCPRHFLLVNTGCMVYRLGLSDPEEVAFGNVDGINRQPDGTYQAVTFSEDWYFAREVAIAGGKVMATRKVTCNHYGTALFPSHKAWGSLINDCDGVEAKASCPVPTWANY